MSDRLSESELIMEVTDLIGLGESQRRKYENIQKSGFMNGDISEAYVYHEQELQLLIKYQKHIIEQQS